jgi:GNAT superfamily N-acetyltransferase
MISDIEIVPLEEKYVNDFMEGITATFAAREVTSVALNLNQDELKILYKSLIKPNTFPYSFVAVKGGNKVVGGCICLDFMKILLSKDDPEYTTSYDLDENIKSAPISIALSLIERQYIDLKEKNGELVNNNILYHYMTFVDEDYKNLGIGKRLYVQVEINAKEKGFKKIATISTGPVSQHVRRDIQKFKEQFKVSYNDPRFKQKDGTLPLANIKTATHLILFEKDIENEEITKF